MLQVLLLRGQKIEAFLFFLVLLQRECINAADRTDLLAQLFHLGSRHASVEVFFEVDVRFG